MNRSPPLPLPIGFSKADDYVQSLLSFIVSSELFQKLCGGVHILEFFTQEPDLYESLLPRKWKEFFHSNDVLDILDLLVREPITKDGQLLRSSETMGGTGSLPPPSDLLLYIGQVRWLNLSRSFHAPGNDNLSSSTETFARHISVGMKPKKIHEVSNLAKFIDNLSSDIHTVTSHQISHFVDFGSGQNYLGRALASPPYNRRVIAVESKPLNIDGARSMDVHARLAKKKIIMRNKKMYRQSICGDHPDSENPTVRSREFQQNSLTKSSSNFQDDHDSNIQYIEKNITNGNLSDLVPLISRSSEIEDRESPNDPQLMVISLHSCGNLLHHGLRSLILNPSVKAVAMVGCCYNLVTERFQPPTYKLPCMRSPNERLDETSSACDPQGFPMSERLAKYQHAHGTGIRFNITARMMAVQAPQNWTETDCESFFTRHFYRALLQKIFVDRGVCDGPRDPEDIVGKKPHQHPSRAGHPIIIGSLRKACYSSFTSYVRGAVAKLKNDPYHRLEMIRCMDNLEDSEIEKYEQDYQHKKKQLSTVWSLMAFSAGLVESAIVVDRWQFLREQREVSNCWVEPVFDYEQSPRNLVVVGVKR